MPSLGGPELLIILVIVIIVFGAGKLPTAFRDLGKGVKEFKKAQAEEDEQVAATSQSSAASVPPAAVPPAAPMAAPTAPSAQPSAAPVANGVNGTYVAAPSAHSGETSTRA